MSFILEKDMTKCIDEQKNMLIDNLRIKDSYRYKFFGKEINIEYRIVDIAIALSKCKLYNINKFKYLSTNDIEILAFIYCNKKISINRLIKLSGIDKEQLLLLLNKLEKKLLINKISEQSYSANDFAIESVPKYFISYELKLSNWFEALEQGNFNKNFSEYSYVVLDEDQIPKNKNIKIEFQKNNVGLLLLNTNNIKILYNPKKNYEMNKYSNMVQKIKFLKELCNNKKWTGI